MKFCPYHLMQSASRHWQFQRITALLLVPLSIWLLVLCHQLFNATYTDVYSWLNKGINNGAISMWLLAVCMHAVLGIQVVLEDYVSDMSWRSRLNIINHVWFSLIALSGFICLQLIFWQGGI